MENILLVKNVKAILDFKRKQLQSNNFVFPDIPFDDVEIHTAVLTVEGEYVDICLRVYVLQRYEQGDVDFDIVFGGNYIAVRGYTPNSLILKNFSAKLYTFNEISRAMEQQYRNDLLSTVIEIFDYVLNHTITCIEKQEHRQMCNSQKRKSKQNCRYIAATKYIITGDERRKRTTPNYSLQQWSVRGFYRTYKSGKKVFIKPSYRKRRCIDNINTGKTAQMPIVYKM